MYYRSVRAIDDLANGGPYSDTWGFVTDTIVNQVSLSQPAEGHETTAIDVVVSWAANVDSVGVDSYAVEVSKNTTFTNMPFTDTVGRVLTSDTVTGLYNDTYYWRVRAIDDLANGGPYSDTRGFVTDTIVNPVGLSQPAGVGGAPRRVSPVSWSRPQAATATPGSHSCPSQTLACPSTARRWPDRRSHAPASSTCRCTTPSPCRSSAPGSLERRVGCE